MAKLGLEATLHCKALTHSIVSSATQGVPIHTPSCCQEKTGCQTSQLSHCLWPLQFYHEKESRNSSCVIKTEFRFQGCYSRVLDLGSLSMNQLIISLMGTTISTLCSHEDFLKCLFVVNIKMLVNIRASEHLVESFCFVVMRLKWWLLQVKGWKGLGRRQFTSCPVLPTQWAGGRPALPEILCENIRRKDWFSVVHIDFFILSL